MPRVAREIVEQRRRRLAELLQDRGYLPVEELCRRLDVSPATCRRDLAALVGERQVHRTFGGALPGGPSPGMSEFDATFASFRQRRRIAQQAKLKIARRAMERIRPGQVVFLDAGTTTFRLAEELRRRPIAPLTVVTHSLLVAAHLAAAQDITVHLLGGRVLPRQGLSLGGATEAAAGAFEFDLALLGAEGLDAAGVWNSQEDVARLQRTIMARSGETYILLDATKIGRPAPVRVFGWEDDPARPVRVISDATSKTLRDFGLNGLSRRFDQKHLRKRTSQ